MFFSLPAKIADDKTVARAHSPNGTKGSIQRRSRRLPDGIQQRWIVHRDDECGEDRHRDVKSSQPFIIEELGIEELGVGPALRGASGT